MTFPFLVSPCTMVLMVCKPTIVLVNFAQVSSFARLLGDLLTDMESMLTKFWVQWYNHR